MLISVTHLATIIGVLESIQAFPALAHVLKLVSASDNPTILAYIADTLNYHRNIFGAIGVLDDCFMALLERYRTFISREVDDRSLLLSLINLASRLQAHEAIAEGLRKRLQHIDNKTTLAAYSPVSDNVMEGSPPTDSDFYDEVERLLSSGSSIDHNTFSRIFEKIVGQMELLWKISGVKIHQLSHLFVRLKAFEPKVFDDLMKRWIRSTLANENRVGLFQALPSLVISGCLCLSTITACTVEYLQATSESEAGTMRSDVAIATLQLLTPVDHHLSLESVQVAIARDLSIELLLSFCRNSTGYAFCKTFTQRIMLVIGLLVSVALWNVYQPAGRILTWLTWTPFSRMRPSHQYSIGLLCIEWTSY